MPGRNNPWAGKSGTSAVHGSRGVRVVAAVQHWRWPFSSCAVHAWCEDERGFKGVVAVSEGVQLEGAWAVGVHVRDASARGPRLCDRRSYHGCLQGSSMWCRIFCMPPACKSLGASDTAPCTVAVLVSRDSPRAPRTLLSAPAGFVRQVGTVQAPQTCLVYAEAQPGGMHVVGHWPKRSGPP